MRTDKSLLRTRLSLAGHEGLALCVLENVTKRGYIRNGDNLGRATDTISHRPPSHYKLAFDTLHEVFVESLEPLAETDIVRLARCYSPYHRFRHSATDATRRHWLSWYASQGPECLLPRISTQSAYTTMCLVGQWRYCSLAD